MRAKEEKDDEEVIENVDYQENTSKIQNNNSRPNSFLCVPISDLQIKEKVKQVLKNAKYIYTKEVP